MKLGRRALQILGLCKLVETLPTVTGRGYYFTELKTRAWLANGKYFVCVGGGGIRNRKKHVLFLRKK